MKLCVTIILLIVTFPSYSLSLSDFIPTFNEPDVPYNNPELPVKPLISVKRNKNAPTTWYCNRSQNNVTNIFCNNNPVDPDKIIAYQGVTAVDNTKMIDNSATSNYAQPNSNQNSLKVMPQLSQPNTQLQQLNPYNLSLPIQPSKDVNMNINQQQIQINIKY